MDRTELDRLPAELREIAQRLRDQRPTASGLELDQIKLQVQSRARRSSTRRQLMRSRFVITAMLVVGMLVSGAGAGLAVSGLSGSGSAGQAQYPTNPTTGTTDTSTVLPTTETNPPTATTEDNVPNNDVPAQETRQVSSDDSSELPFTGYAAIPVLLAGIGLLSIGLVMRRRTRNQS